jgi:hypothetical protein
MRKASSIAEAARLEEQRAAKILRDNQFLDRIIEVGTRALRRELMSGETLRAPRQQLRRLRASAFDLLLKLPAIARLSGARRVFGVSRQGSHKPPTWPVRSAIVKIQKNVQMIRKNSAWLTRCWSIGHCGSPCAAFCFREGLIA